MVTFVPALRVGPREHALAGEQHAAGRARELRLEHVLEPVEADVRVRRVALGRVHGGVRRRDRTEDADDLRRDVGDRRGAVGALRQRGAVGGEQRRARRQRHVPREPLVGLQPREQEAPREVDGGARAAAGERHLERLVQRSEQPRGHEHLHRYHAVAALADPLCRELEERRGARVLAVLGGEPRFADGGAGGRVEQRVHVAVVARGPGLHVARDHVPLRARGRGAHHEDDPERDHRDHRDGYEQTEAATPKTTPASRPRTPLRYANSQNPLCHLNVKR